MIDKVENLLRDLISALQIIRLYAKWHPSFKKSVEKAYLSLQEAFEDKEELVIGIIGEELAFGKEIFFDLSNSLKPMILYLKERGIEKIVFLRGIEKEELERFILFLATPREELKAEPQDYLLNLGIKNITAGKIKAEPLPPLDEKMENSLSYLTTYEASLDRVTSSVENILDQKDLDQLALRFAVQEVMDKLSGRYQDFVTFSTLKRYDTKTFSHILNVSLLSMFFCAKLGFAKEVILEVGTAGLFHDIGKLYISRKILAKPEKLNEEEFGKMRSHVIIGAEILLKYVDRLGMLPAVVCFEHHLKYDLSGYPKIAFYCKPLGASLIVSICDVYDALSQKRGYKSDYPPEMIYDIMIKERGTAFDPELLDKFFQIMGVWPIGTIVSLSDSRIAVVREVNEDDIISPKVEILPPKETREIIDLKLTKDTLKIERSLNPLTEGKQYLPYV